MVRGGSRTPRFYIHWRVHRAVPHAVVSCTPHALCAAADKPEDQRLTICNQELCPVPRPIVYDDAYTDWPWTMTRWDRIAAALVIRD